MPDREKVIEELTKLPTTIYGGLYQLRITHELRNKVIALLKEQEDIGTELTNAMELVHKKNERIKKLEEQIETLTRWRANAGAFDKGRQVKCE